MVFDGAEFLPFTTKSIRNNIDFISVTYQETSYFGNKADEDLLPTLEKLKSMNLIDELIHYKNDLSIHHKTNELNLRNVGLQASRDAGCTHHISADVDEFYVSDQLEYVKNVMYKEKYNYSVVTMSTYYKDPTFMVYPDQNLLVTLIHPVENEYTLDVNYPTFPFHMETTRRLKQYDNYKLFDKNEFKIHHMSYVRKDIRRKFANSDNARFYKLDKFLKTYDNYKLGDRVCLLPDYKNRRTVLVDNIFNINF